MSRPWMSVPAPLALATAGMVMEAKTSWDWGVFQMVHRSATGIT